MTVPRLVAHHGPALLYALIAGGAWTAIVWTVRWAISARHLHERVEAEVARTGGRRLVELQTENRLLRERLEKYSMLVRTTAHMVERVADTERRGG